ncbi:hypothetical protein A6A08_21960 [Nocardiopsis sp. TSRI0078]|uniref:hypothetical protein n=1 Tax=unclassified Nocardiopsis TaxID=2649073 RepID=UPI00093EE62F|nr:hypothetical protein [Nocardiopsis sp. TSRI0078]OKI21040.1 hypothetical protein A6A08_21960 [Nocardiopsis sp. TSRI0078]
MNAEVAYQGQTSSSLLWLADAREAGALDGDPLTDPDARVEMELHLLVRRAAHAMDPAAAFAEPGRAMEATPERARADDLARLRAAEVLREELAEHAAMLAIRAGHRREAPVTYADLGDAVGITRQSAAARWSGAIPDAKPGRPRIDAVEPPSTDDDQEHERVPAPAPQAGVHLELLTVEQADALDVDAARMYRVLVDGVLAGYLWRTREEGLWSCATATDDGGLAAIAVVGSPRYRRVCRQVLDHLLDHLADPDRYRDSWIPAAPAHTDRLSQES